MDDQIVNTLSKSIDMLSQKLSVPAAKLYAVLSQQLKYDTMISLICLGKQILFLVILFFITRSFIRSVTRENGFFYEESHSKELSGLLTIAASLFLLVVWYTILCSLSDSIIKILQIWMSPDYYMFQEYIKPLIK